jgi:hypothetical protein
VVPEERLQEIEAQIAAFAVDESRTEPLAFPASLPSHERKVVHRLAEEYNLSHESFGLGKERHIQVHSPHVVPCVPARCRELKASACHQVSKQPDVKERTLETLSVSMKRRFVKDFDIPIKVRLWPPRPVDPHSLLVWLVWLTPRHLHPYARSVSTPKTFGTSWICTTERCKRTRS